MIVVILQLFLLIIYSILLIIISIYLCSCLDKYFDVSDYGQGFILFFIFGIIIIPLMIPSILLTGLIQSDYTLYKNYSFYDIINKKAENFEISNKFEKFELFNQTFLKYDNKLLFLNSCGNSSYHKRLHYGEYNKIINKIKLNFNNYFENNILYFQNYELYTNITITQSI